MASLTYLAVGLTLAGVTATCLSSTSPCLFTWWWKGSQQQERVSPSVQAQLQLLLASHLLVLHLSKQGTWLKLDYGSDLLKVW